MDEVTEVRVFVLDHPDKLPDVVNIDVPRIAFGLEKDLAPELIIQHSVNTSVAHVAVVSDDLVPLFTEAGEEKLLKNERINFA
jgi:hypothetical protein